MNITVWNENVHEKTDPDVRRIHPDGVHGTVASIVREIEGAQVRTATLDEPHIGLDDAVLDGADVLIWWGHVAHDKVPDEIVEKIARRVLSGMGLVVLHSGHHSKIFKRLLGTTCDLRWRDDTYERLFCVNPSHPIAEGIPMILELGTEECYAEYFDVPAPDELVFSGWFDIGETFRSGCVWKRGYGKIFYFQPGHETNRSFFNPHVRRIIQNACRWAAPVRRREEAGCPHIDPTLEQQRQK